MTKPDIESIRARCDKTTAGPWTWGREAGYIAFGYLAEGSWNHDLLDCDRAEANAEFIVMARHDIPALLAYVAELESRLDSDRWHDAEQDPPEISDLYLWHDSIGFWAVEYYSVEHGYAGGDTPTHWRPLPKPPQEVTK